MYMKKIYLMLPVLAGLVLAGCRQQTTEAPDDNTREENAVFDTVGLEIVPMDVEEAAPAPKPAKAKAVAPAPKQTKAKAETIYVETYGAQGRVWGHVTMKGDKGSGTIHDWDENTLAITVTRHGNELFAVDQNSRQYVFKLK